jgi:magnesium-transporting ATPase (P-type)
MTASSTPAVTGLTEQQARSRLEAEGYNELPRQARRTPLRIVLEVLREPMLALLVGAGLVYLLLGDLKEALILLAFGLMSVVITVIQETRTERVLEALRDLTSPRALVIRDGERRRIAGRDVARGDLIVLAEGDRVPADGSLCEASDLQTDESLLTGESVPVRKVAADRVAVDHPPPGGDDQPYVYSGSLVVRGSGIAEVIATGPRIVQGALAFGVVALVYVVGLRRGMPENEARALGFFALVLTIFSLVLVNRSFSSSLIAAFRLPNAALGWILLTIAAVLAAVLDWPAASLLFRFGPLHGDDLLVTIFAAAAVLLVLEALKPIWRARLRV